MLYSLVDRAIMRVVNEEWECWTTPDLPVGKKKNYRQNTDDLSKNIW